MPLNFSAIFKDGSNVAEAIIVSNHLLFLGGPGGDIYGGSGTEEIIFERG